MKKFTNQYWFLIFCSCIIIFFIVLWYKSNQWTISLQKNSKFTICYVVSDWHQKNNRGVGADLEFPVNGIMIKRTTNYDLKKGGKYLVLYDSLKPSNYLLLYNHQINEKVIAPSKGWKFNEIPILIDSTDLKEYFKKLGIKQL